MKKFKKFFLTIKPTLCVFLASLIVTFCWHWYHSPHRPHGRWVFLFALSFILLFLGFLLAKKVLVYVAKKFKKSAWVRQHFLDFLDELYFVGSLLFLIFLSRHELINLIYFILILFLIFYRFNCYLARGAFAKYWREVGRVVFLLGLFIFIVSAFFQYFAYAFYILDANIRFYNIVLFRSWAMTMFWLFGFAVFSIIYQKFSGRVKNLFLIFWALIFITSLLLGVINVGVLYYSGLYFSPVVWAHAGGGTAGVFYKAFSLLLAVFLLLTGSFIFIFKKYISVHRRVHKKYWYYYNFAIIAMAIFSFLSVTSLKNTPEALILKSFWRDWRGTAENVELAPIVREKLKRFGITHDLDEFHVNYHESIFSEPISPEFTEQKPNVVILFLESFSSRLTGVYNDRFPGLTPGLQDFANNSRTTVFKNYYNASTPTITGLINQLCSFLPPTGHEEIEKEKKLQKHHLDCLPNILKENGYGKSTYFTAVDKDFANKDSILASMGVGRVIGEEEFSEIIDEDPLSWGYSDHQTLSVVWDKMIESSRQDPFFMLWSSVDSHPPFDRVKDVVKYGDGGSRLLNSVQTTDDAFKQFWEKFQHSEFYDNTILVVVADHAVFPSAYDRHDFPEEAGQMTYYDELLFMTYTPAEILPQEVNTRSFSIDFAPTLLHILNINTSNFFEGHSIFGDRVDYPNLLGMHEFGLYINELSGGQSKTSYVVPNDLDCRGVEFSTNPDTPLTLCEYFNYFSWKRQAFEQGRFWRGFSE